METIKVRDLIEPTYVKVKDILPGKSGYNLYLKVVSKNVLIDIERIDKTRVVIADFVCGDETGVIKMRLRNGKIIIDRSLLENMVDLILEGETIIVRNCKVPVVNSHLRMQVDAFGKIEISKDLKITDVKADKDLSAAVYDNYATRSRYTGSRERERDFKSQYTYSYNDVQSEGTFLSSQIGK